MPADQNIMDFILEKMPIGVVVFNEKMAPVHLNKIGKRFICRFRIPSEIKAISKRIFESIRNGTIKQNFPGEIHLSMKLGGSQSKWNLRFFISESPKPLVFIFIIEESLSGSLDMNTIRKEYRLTRRETDIVRRILDGYKNPQIADDLGIAEQTVKDHLRSVYSKCKVQSRLKLTTAIYGLFGATIS